ncbi:uncharacterized protein BO87DRAFT_412524 [Aspergillus neoniger CBS 115656]|uniref:Uncharacterized protein n=1 Tax=Aspergillus neoniger (strain CBS 115656) TaxID=1448310 RepID=A0A318YV95_ASPNB|nr:hypothetical protein BO87DRAFT_412524 [Aspergillus neoniger CBS 115656]PYH38711.1 hypothetical protein BO87DRAFT_412524 [Aspergillus neoniger CBS 115656]
MPWSIDTSLSFITLLLTGISFLLKIWNHVVNWSYSRVLPQGVARSTPETSIIRRQQQHRHQLHSVDPEILLESGLHPGAYQTLIVNQLFQLYLRYLSIGLYRDSIWLWDITAILIIFQKEKVLAFVNRNTVFGP